jgi:hypothetical protein
VAATGVRGRLRAAGGAFATTWRNRDLRRAQLAFAGAWSAEWAFTVGLGVLAYDQGGATAVGLVSLLRMLPSLVVVPFASVYADRHRREVLLVRVSVARGVTAGLMAVLVAVDAPVAGVYALAVVSTAAAVTFRPVHAALMPSLCRTPSELAGANVVRGMVDSLSTLLGPAVAGALLVTNGPAAVFVACAVAALLSAVAIARVAPEERVAAGGTAQAPGVVADLVAGLRTIAGSRHLAVLAVLAEVQILMRGALTVLSVVVAIDLLDIGESGVGTLNTAVGAGAVAGSVLASFVGSHRLAAWFGLGVALWGLPLALVGILPVTGFAIAVLLLVGVGNALVDLGLFTLVARLTPHDQVARVFGALEGIAALCFGVSAVLVPVAIELLGTRGALVAVGLVAPASVALTWATLRRLDGTMGQRDREVDLLRSVEMLAALPLPAVEALAIALEPMAVPAGETVVRQGESGSHCYVLEDGVAEVLGDGRVVAALGRGELFGEIALLRDVPRTATVRARSDLRLQALAREDFLPVVTGYRASAGRATTTVDDQLQRYQPIDE